MFAKVGLIDAGSILLVVKTSVERFDFAFDETLSVFAVCRKALKDGS